MQIATVVGGRSRTPSRASKARATRQRHSVFTHTSTNCAWKANATARARGDAPPGRTDGRTDGQTNDELAPVTGRCVLGGAGGWC